MSLINSNTYKGALKRIKASNLQGKTIAVIGATGMIGSCLVDTLMQWNRESSVPCNVVAVGRSAKYARDRFEQYWEQPNFSFCEHDVCQEISAFPARVDYIIHAGSNADPVSYAREPVDTLLANVIGTDHLLRYGLAHGMARFLYISSGEMYGQPNERMDDFQEDYCGPIDYSAARACYPAGKRAAEVLCQSYIKQYKADVVIVRPCHVFGPTMTQRDSRAVSEFLRNAVDGKDIIMKSAGLVERSHCYVIDAVQGILTVLLHGECGAAYNIADTQYQMKIREFAFKCAHAGASNVIFENPSDIEASGYSKISRAVLDATKLRMLGWKPYRADVSAIQETVAILRELK